VSVPLGFVRWVAAEPPPSRRVVAPLLGVALGSLVGLFLGYIETKTAISGQGPVIAAGVVGGLAGAGIGFGFGWASSDIEFR